MFHRNLLGTLGSAPCGQTESFVVYFAKLLVNKTIQHQW